VFILSDICWEEIEFDDEEEESEPCDSEERTNKTQQTAATCRLPDDVTETLDNPQQPPASFTAHNDVNQPFERNEHEQEQQTNSCPAAIESKSDSTELMELHEDRLAEKCPANACPASEIPAGVTSSYPTSAEQDSCPHSTAAAEARPDTCPKSAGDEADACSEEEEEKKEEEDCVNEVPSLICFLCVEEEEMKEEEEDCVDKMPLLPCVEAATQEPPPALSTPPPTQSDRVRMGQSEQPQNGEQDVAVKNADSSDQAGSENVVVEVKALMKVDNTDRQSPVPKNDVLQQGMLEINIDVTSRALKSEHGSNQAAKCANTTSLIVHPDFPIGEPVCEEGSDVSRTKMAACETGNGPKDEAVKKPVNGTSTVFRHRGRGAQGRRGRRGRVVFGPQLPKDEEEEKRLE
jgi:hypothetical protein